VKSGTGVIWPKNTCFHRKAWCRWILWKSETDLLPRKSDQECHIKLSILWYITLGPTRCRKNTGWHYVTSVNSEIL